MQRNHVRHQEFNQRQLGDGKVSQQATVGNDVDSMMHTGPASNVIVFPTEKTG
jgi:hypothetical protein